jgi:hypothetical protein
VILVGILAIKTKIKTKNGIVLSINKRVYNIEVFKNIRIKMEDMIDRKAMITILSVKFFGFLKVLLRKEHIERKKSYIKMAIIDKVKINLKLGKRG